MKHLIFLKNHFSRFLMLTTLLTLSLQTITPANALDPESPLFDRIINHAVHKAPKQRPDTKAQAKLEDELATLLKNPKTPRSALQKVGETLVSHYLDTNQIQEAAWTLQSLDEWRLANILQERLLSFITRAATKKSEELGGGVTKTYKDSLGAGINVVFKKGRPAIKSVEENPLREVLAFELSNLLGLKLVPATVFFKGKSNGSRMLFVENTEHSGLGFDYSDPSGYDTEKELYVLDVLTQNPDRHGANSLHRPGQKLVAIDHERVGLGETEIDIDTLPKEILPTGRLYQRLKQVTLQELRSRLAKLATPEDIRGIFNRIQTLTRASKKAFRNPELRDFLPFRLRRAESKAITVKAATDSFMKYAARVTKTDGPALGVLKLREWIDWHEAESATPEQYRKTLNEKLNQLIVRAKLTEADLRLITKFKEPEPAKPRDINDVIKEAQTVITKDRARLSEELSQFPKIKNDEKVSGYLAPFATRIKEVRDETLDAIQMLFDESLNQNNRDTRSRQVQLLDQVHLQTLDSAVDAFKAQKIRRRDLRRLFAYTLSSLSMTRECQRMIATFVQKHELLSKELQEKPDFFETVFEKNQRVGMENTLKHFQILNKSLSRRRAG